MKKKLTFYLERDVYEGLHHVAKGNISEFLEKLLRPVVAPHILSYKELAKDEEDAREALKWCEAHIGDVADDPEE